MKSIVIASVVCLIMSGCFSNKGLPVKTVGDGELSEETTQLTDFSVDHSAWDAMLKKYVTDNGNVDYKGFKADSEALNSYITHLSKQVPTNDWSLQEQMAYFVNVYNANVINLIVENYPTKSIKDVSNPWLKERIMVGDKSFSLAGIEKGVLQKMGDPRIHFAINCASISCPKILTTAYTADNVDDLMDRAAKEFINNKDKNVISENNPKISEIFKWYKSDFTDTGMTIIDYINQYSTTKINPNATIDYLSYDWGLNEKN